MDLSNSISAIPEEKLEKIVKKIRNSYMIFLATFYDKSYFNHSNIPQKKKKNFDNHSQKEALSKEKIASNQSFKDILNCKKYRYIAKFMEDTLSKLEGEVINKMGFKIDQYISSLRKVVNKNE